MAQELNQIQAEIGLLQREGVNGTVLKSGSGAYMSCPMYDLIRPSERLAMSNHANLVYMWMGPTGVHHPTNLSEEA